jgi:hypothetical protein
MAGISACCIRLGRITGDLAMEILRCVMPPDMCDELERKTDFEGTSEVVVDPGMCAILLKMHGR